MKQKRHLIAIALLVLAGFALAVWRQSLSKPNEIYIRLSELPGVSQEVLASQDKLLHVEEPVLLNRKTGMAFFVVEILSRKNFGNERFLTFGGDAKSLQNFVSEIELVNNGPSFFGPAGDGMVEGVETLVSGVLQLLRHPIDTVQGVRNAVVELANYVKDTPFSKIQTDVSNLANAYYVNSACEVADSHGVDYFELKTHHGRGVIHFETKSKLAGNGAVQIAILLVPFAGAPEAAETEEIADAASTGEIATEDARFLNTGATFPRMVEEETAALTRLRNAEPPREFTPPVASFGKATTSDYRLTFFKAYPDLEGKVVVHHAVEQQALTRYPGLLTEEEMHSLENLRGIANDQNADLHLSQIRKDWNEFYRNNPASSMTKQKLLDKASEIDRRYGTSFTPSPL
jgi:hypothetical protein